MTVGAGGVDGELLIEVPPVGQTGQRVGAGNVVEFGGQTVP